MQNDETLPETPKTYHDFLDTAAGVMISKMKDGMAPSALWMAFADWSMDLAIAPGKQAKLLERATQTPGLVAAGPPVSAAALTVGQDLAVTPGKVVARSYLAS